MEVFDIRSKKLIKNIFNINDMVYIKNYDNEYRVVEISLDTLSDKCNIIWYKLYRLSDGYTCEVKENILEIVNK